MNTQDLPGGVPVTGDLLVRFGTHRWREAGDVHGSLHDSRTALGIAEGRDDRHAVATLLTHLGLMRFLLGEPDGAELALGRADDLFRRLPLRPGNSRWPLVPCYRALLLNGEDRVEEAIAEFDRARELAEQLDEPAYAAIADARFAIVHGGHPAAPERAERAASVPLDVPKGWTGSLRARAIAGAALAHGDAARARSASLEAIGADANPLEDAQAEVVLAVAEAALGHRGVAAARIESALTLLEVLDAAYPLVTAEIYGADLLPARAAELLARADERSGDNPLYARVWSHRPVVVVTTGPAPSVVAGNRALPLRGRPLQLVAEVAGAGPGGLHWERLAARLWPDEGDPARLRSRITTTTADARKALGAEAWRLRREGPTLCFALRNAEVRRCGERGAP